MYVGQGLDRVDARAKVTGRARYAAEFAPQNLVHAVLVQSTVAAGSIEGFDLAAARAMPGVLAIITPDNAPKLKTGPAAGPALQQGLLQNPDIFYQGQHIAIVVARSLEQATEAAAQVTVRTRGGEAITAMEPALAAARKPKNFQQGRAEADSRTGDPDAAYAAAAVKIAQTYVTPIEHHNPMEPHATIAAWEGDRLTLWTTTQGISDAHKGLATLFALPPENVTILCPYLGGGFGSKGNTWPPAALAAMAARVAGRPVKLEITREQMFSSNGYRPRTIQNIKLAADADGRLTAISHDVISQTSLQPIGEFAESSALATRMLYACDAIATSHRLVDTNFGLPTYMRAPGEASGVFALESAMDELAMALKMDPVALRLKNYADQDSTEKKPFASKALRACYTQGAEAFGWSTRAPEPRSMRNGRMLVGWGMATSTYPTNRRPASARVRLLPDGTALVQSGSQDLGTGTYTVMAQVAADELGMPIARVRAELGDSRLPPAPGSGGSSTIASVMPAVQEAAAAARLALAKLAADHNLPATAIADLLAAAKLPYVEGLAAAKLSPEAAKYSRHAFGAQFVEVEVDPDTGTPRITRWVGAFDCGRVMNAKTAHSQLIGGIVYGIGMAMFEETRVDPETGRIVNANIAEYLVPVHADTPDLKIIVADSHDPITTPLGPKGIGELSMVGAAPAIANAIFHATGVRVRSLPIRLETLLT